MSGIMNDIEKAEKLRKAKLKVKAFKAKKSKDSSSSSSASSDGPVASTSRISIERKRHSHRKSSSRHSIPPAQPSAVALSRRNSRHSRTDSICNVHTMVTEIAQPVDAMATWVFPRSPPVPSAMSPELTGSPFASGSRHLQPRRASLQHPPLSPSAGSAIVQSTVLTQRRTSLQPEVLSNGFSPAFVSTPIMPSLSGVMAVAHSRRNSRHSRKLSIGTTRESFEIMSGHSLNPAEAATPETDRMSALEVLEGRSPTVASASLPQILPDLGISNLPPVTNKRGSWSSSMTSSASLGGIAQAGGRGAIDLGMLVEEEEENQSDVFDAHSGLSPRRRPQSLFLPAPAPNGDGTTSDTLSPTEELVHPFSSTPARGYRPLSMVASPVAALSNAADAPKRAGLRSLTLSHGSAAASVVGASSQRRSLMSSTNSTRRISIGPSSAVGKRTSISYRSATPASKEDIVSPVEADTSGDRSHLLARIAGLESDLATASAKQRVLEAGNAASQAILKAKELELSTVHVKMASLQAELQSHGDLGTRVVDLEAQLAESSERFTAELDILQERCKEAELERDDLKEDIQGWRSRCADLARNVERERARVEEERREGAAAREQVRKLGERLAAASSASATAKNNADEALAEAQAKLITEMRDQIFSLAGQLERERAAHSATQAQLHGQPSPSIQEADDEMQNFQSDRESDAGSSVTSSSAFEARRSFNTTADASFSTMASEEIPPSRPLSFSQTKLPEQAGVPITLGGLQTLAEEEEEETEEEDTRVPMLVESSSPAHGQGSGGSTCSTASEAMPKTPLKETPPEIDHDRSHSFMKNWKFPMGSVQQQVHIVGHEDNSFFGISQAQILPPLAVSEDALALPPFTLAGLVVDPDWQPTVKAEPAIKPKPKVELAAPAKSKGPGRLSLANFGSLISSYVAPPPAPAPKAAPKPEHSRRDSLLFAGEGDSRPPLLLARTSGPRRSIKASEARRPQPGPLAELDFTAACACRSGARTLRI